MKPSMISPRSRWARAVAGGARLSALLALGFASGGGRAASLDDTFPLPSPELSVPSAREVVERAFENFYGCDLRQTVEFIVRQHGEVVLRYETHMLRKHIDGVAHELLYVVGRNESRDWKVLRIDRRDRADDAFVYRPDLRRPRRYPTAQRADKLWGMELTIEDLEILRIDKFEVLGRAFGEMDGEPVHAVALQRLEPAGYDRVDFFIAERDYAMLEFRFYRDGEVEPFKVGRVPRSSMETVGGHVLPRTMTFENRERNTETETVFRDRVVNPDIPRSLFSPSVLERKGRLLRFSAQPSGTSLAEANK